MFPMDTKTLQIFALALLANDLPITSIVEDAASWQIDGVNIWLFRLKGFPGPTFANLPANSTSYCHWYHTGGLETVFGALATGTILPCCSDGLQLPSMIPLPGSLVEYGEKILRFHKSSYFKTVEICIPMGRMLMVFIFLEPFWAITLGYLELLRGWNSLRASKLAWLRARALTNVGALGQTTARFSLLALRVSMSCKAA